MICRNKKNILILTSDYIPKPLWGMGRYVETFTLGLKEYYYDKYGYIIATAYKDRDDVSNMITTEYELDNKLLSKNPFCIFDNFMNYMLWQRELAKKVINECMIIPNLIYCNNWMSWETAKILKKHFNCKVVTSIHFLQKQYELMCENPTLNCNNDIIQIEKDMLIHSDGLIFFSENSRDMALSYCWFPKNKTKVIYHTSFLNSSNITFSDKSNELVYIGRLSIDKGLDKLIEIHNIINHKIPVVLNIIGEGDFKVPENSMINSYGYLDNNEKIIKILKRSKLFCLFSNSEVFPISVLDCMSCGVYPILAKNNNIPKMFDIKSGCYFNITNWNNARWTIAKYIVDFLKNNWLEKCENSYSYYHKFYTKKKMVESTLKFFENYMG